MAFYDYLKKVHELSQVQKPTAAVINAQKAAAAQSALQRQAAAHQEALRKQQEAFLREQALIAARARQAEEQLRAEEQQKIKDKIARDAFESSQQSAALAASGAGINPQRLATSRLALVGSASQGSNESSGTGNYTFNDAIRTSSLAGNKYYQGQNQKLGGF